LFVFAIYGSRERGKSIKNSAGVLKTGKISISGKVGGTRNFPALVNGSCVYLEIPINIAFKIFPKVVMELELLFYKIHRREG